MKIDFANLQYQHRLYQDEIEEAILKVSRNCNYIMGKEVQELEMIDAKEWLKNDPPSEKSWGVMAVTRMRNA